MCEARPAEVPPLVNRPKALGGPQPSGWHQPKVRLSKRVALIGAGRRLNVWRLLRGLNGSYSKAPMAVEPADGTIERRAELCIAVISEDRFSFGYFEPCARAAPYR